MSGRRRLALIGLVVALVAGAVVTTTLLIRSGQEDIFLEGKNSTGRNPFTAIASVKCPAGSVQTGNECVLVAPEPGDTTTSTTSSTPTTAVGGPTTTALFGGSGDQKVCDPEGLIAFLRGDPAKAKAWVDALNADPVLLWSGGNQLTVEDVPTYVRELTPTFLAVDTRVTNHGYIDGRAVPHQSVLQAGTAVLVDKSGIPRVRCACGNPLLPPKKVDNPHYEGPCWEDEPKATTTRRPRPTTTTTTRPTTTTTSTRPTLSVVPNDDALGPESIQLVFARSSNRCGDEPYCSPPGCTVDTTTTVPATTTTLEGTTTTGGVTTVSRFTTTSRRTATTQRPVTTVSVPPVTTTPPTTMPAPTTTRATTTTTRFN